MMDTMDINLKITTKRNELAALENQMGDLINKMKMAENTLAKLNEQRAQKKGEIKALEELI
jgi:predicted  nucleic acid-binding Zn-ribbon protein